MPRLRQDVEVLAKYQQRGLRTLAGESLAPLQKELSSLRQSHGVGRRSLTLEEISFEIYSAVPKLIIFFLFISLFFNFYFYSCTTSVGYGDAKSFQAVSSPQTYGEAYTIRKKDCIGHVQKWMGSRLRRWQGENRKIVLEDGKSVVISKRLTDSLIDE